MFAAEIRQRFLDYFRRHGHAVVASSPLIPQNDPTLFFTNAGMVQFKDVFLGEDKRDYRRAATVQKCLRVSGKHNDLENVGHTARHHTFFEMLGNFSFGDYFKVEAIRFAWEFLTKEMEIDPSRLWVTVYEEDDEALEIWRDRIGVPAARIQRLGKADNFWAMGDTGPCGPCTEIHYDHGPGISDNLDGPGGGDPRYVEIWNLVFMQYDRAADGTLTPLPRPSIDTGMGLERLAAVKQGVFMNYDTDLFQVIIQHAARLAGKVYGADPATDVALKVIADHARATAFLIADGVMPSNEGRGYVLRRIMRRAIRYGVKIGLSKPFLVETTATVISHFGDAYPELRERAAFIREVVLGEEQRFAATLRQGLGLLEREISGGPARISGEVAFALSGTYGFPFDLTELIAAEHGLTVDHAGYAALLEEEKERGRKHWGGSGSERIAELWRTLAAQPTRFTGYAQGAAGDRGAAVVRAIIAEGAEVDALVEGQSGEVLLDSTPFYAESGGQVGDTGALSWEGGAAEVGDCQKPVPELHVHHVTVRSGVLRAGAAVVAAVDAGRRDRTRLNHTGTHLLHAALRQVLGGHVSQKGSLVGPDRLRFDFAHHKPMTAEEIARVEDLVNAEILANAAVDSAVLPIEEAKQRGAVALFGEKYGEVVRVISVGGFSTEFCGGTHARRAGDIGFLKILSESGTAAGVRRIEAQTGPGAARWVREQEALLGAAVEALKSTPAKLLEDLRRLQEERARLGRELEQARVELARASIGDLSARVTPVNGVPLLVAEVPLGADHLRDEADRWRDKLGSAAVVLVSRSEGAVRLAASVSKDLAGKRVHAGKLVGALAGIVGGRGGGRPDFAQAGGPEVAKVPELMAAVAGLIG